jgi:hypothetical protein
LDPLEKKKAAEESSFDVLCETDNSFRVAERVEKVEEAIWGGEWTCHRGVFSLVTTEIDGYRYVNPD